MTMDLQKWGKNGALFVIAGPCVIESRDMAMQTAERLLNVCRRFNVPLAFKASYDKANRTAGDAFRGPGLEKGLRILREIQEAFQVPVLTDVHTPEEAACAAEVVDIVQIPAFLARQTDLLIVAGKSAKAVNIKKAQFMAPWEMQQAVEKVRAAGDPVIWVTERGTLFGYQNLVVDFRSLPILRETGCPVVFDATHSTQRPAAQGRSSGGDREMAPVLARAAAAVGIDGLFCEVHPDPEHARSDAATQLSFGLFESTLTMVLKIHDLRKKEEQR